MWSGNTLQWGQAQTKSCIGPPKVWDRPWLNVQNMFTIEQTQRALHVQTWYRLYKINIKKENMLQKKTHKQINILHIFKNLTGQKTKSSASNCLSKTSFLSWKARAWTSAAADKALCGVSYFLGEWCNPTKRLYWFKLINPLTEEGDSVALERLK